MIRIIPEHFGTGRLGRHVEHDERSRGFELVSSRVKPKTTLHKRHCKPWNQGELGACTGFAMAGALMTGPLYVPGRELSERDAVSLYAHATALDHIKGTYPPADTGSSGLAAAKAAYRSGYIEAYRHTFCFEGALRALTRGPVIVGVNWYAGFDSPIGDHAELRISGDVRGGHEVCLVGLDVEAGILRACNSWGTDWADDGYFMWSFETFRQLLKEDGDVVVPIPSESQRKAKRYPKSHPWRRQKYVKGES